MTRSAYRGKRLSPRTRRAIQTSTESVRALAARYDVDPKTVMRWRHRSGVESASMGRPRSALSRRDEAIIVSIRRNLLLSLDDLLYTLQATIPQLTRNSLHRCLVRHGVSRLPRATRLMIAQQERDISSFGSFRLHLARIPTESGNLRFIMAFDRTSKLRYYALHGNERIDVREKLVAALIAAAPYKINAVITDVTVDKLLGAGRANAGVLRLCAKHGVAYRVVDADKAWSKAQIDRMNKLFTALPPHTSQTLSASDVQNQARSFVTDYHQNRRLKTLGGVTPYQFVRKLWRQYPKRFHREPCPDNWDLF